MNLRYVFNAIREEKAGHRTRGKCNKKQRVLIQNTWRIPSSNFFDKDKQHKGKLTKRFEQAVHKRYSKANELM